MKKIFNDIHNNWESYLKNCQKGNIFTVNKYHLFYTNFIALKNEFEKIVDSERYLVKASLGEGNLAGIPWIAIMDKSITITAKEEYYIVYLFSRNAKNVYLTLGLGATQFDSMWGENQKCLEKIKEARDKYIKSWDKYLPENEQTNMNLIEENDTEFLRKFSKKMVYRAQSYESGSIIPKNYDLTQTNINYDYVSDFKDYLSIYKSISDDPLTNISTDLMAEESADSTDNPIWDFDYNPEITNPKLPNNNTNKKSSKTRSGFNTPYTYSPDTSKSGKAGEEYVFEYEKQKLNKLGKSSLANKVVDQYSNLTNFPGYDIKSYNENGEEIYIEVKSTKGDFKNTVAHRLTVNELKAAKVHKEKYYLYFVEKSLTKPHIKSIIQNPIKQETENKMFIEPKVYELRFDIN